MGLGLMGSRSETSPSEQLQQDQNATKETEPVLKKGNLRQSIVHRVRGMDKAETQKI